ncbi:MAG: SDR family oxidoreductase [Deltaproteobacteria bacterium]|nr:SDR family oxidoreductase [Deltaproteobacteria bacterium]
MSPTIDPSSLVVLVTGATSGFGAATARRFAREGARVVAAGRRLERLQALAAELGERCHPLQLDVCDLPGVDAALAGLPAEFAAIDVLVNNAGLALGLDPAQRASWQDWETMIDTNVKGLAYVTHAVLPGMVERKRGHVVNLGSIAGEYPYPGGNAYGGTKAFVKLFSLNLRADLLGTPVRVTNIEPGLCESEFSVVRFHGDAEAAKKVYAGTEPITPDDIAETIFWSATLPPHVNINRIELMPTCQAAGPLAIHRGPLG